MFSVGEPGRTTYGKYSHSSFTVASQTAPTNRPPRAGTAYLPYQERTGKSTWWYSATRDATLGIPTLAGFPHGCHKATRSPGCLVCSSIRNPQFRRLWTTRSLPLCVFARGVPPSAVRISRLLSTRSHSRPRIAQPEDKVGLALSLLARLFPSIGSHLHASITPNYRAVCPALYSWPAPPQNAGEAKGRLTQCREGLPAPAKAGHATKSAGASAWMRSSILVQADGPEVSQTLLDSTSMLAQSAPGRSAVNADSPMMLLVRCVPWPCSLGVIRDVYSFPRGEGEGVGFRI